MRKKREINKKPTQKSCILQKHEEIMNNYKNKPKKLNDIDTKINVLNKEIINLKKEMSLYNINKKGDNNSIQKKIKECESKIKEFYIQQDDIKTDKSFNKYMIDTFMIINKSVLLDEQEYELLENQVDESRDIEQLLYKLNLEKNLLIDEYNLILDPNYLVNRNNFNINDYKYCKNCNDSLHSDGGGGGLVCYNCGIVYNCTVISEELSYKEKQEMDHRTQFTYDKRTHLLEWIRRFQSKENKDISQDILDKVILEAHKSKIFDLNKLDEKRVKLYLKKLKLNEYYDNVITIINRINKRPPFVLTSEIENKIMDMFQQMQDPFDKFKGNRKNMLSYGYILNKYFLMLDLPEFSKYFFLLKSPDKLRQQDEIFKKIVDHMAKVDKTTKWVFYPSL